MELYRQKEIEFPVKVGHGAVHGRPAAAQAPGGQRYDREGLYQLGA